MNETKVIFSIPSELPQHHPNDHIPDELLMTKYQPHPVGLYAQQCANESKPADDTLILNELQKGQTLALQTNATAYRTDSDIWVAAHTDDRFVFRQYRDDSLVLEYQATCLPRDLEEWAKALQQLAPNQAQRCIAFTFGEERYPCDETFRTLVQYPAERRLFLSLVQSFPWNSYPDHAVFVDQLTKEERVMEDKSHWPFVFLQQEASVGLVRAMVTMLRDFGLDAFEPYVTIPFESWMSDKHMECDRSGVLELDMIFDRYTIVPEEKDGFCWVYAQSINEINESCYALGCLFQFPDQRLGLIYHYLFKDIYPDLANRKAFMDEKSECWLYAGLDLLSDFEQEEWTIETKETIEKWKLVLCGE